MTVPDPSPRPADPPADCTPPAGSKDHQAAVLAAYQVSARLLASEQQTIWSRTQGYFALNAIGAGVASQLSPCAQTALAVVGLLVAFAFGRSLHLSWGFRHLFAATLRSHEEWLGLYTAWQQRGYSLKTLADLYAAQYFAVSSTSPKPVRTYPDYTKPQPEPSTPRRRIT